MILPNTQIILYKPRAAAVCWVAESKTAKLVSAIYASTIKLYAYTTEAEAIAKAASIPAKAGVR